MGLLFYAIIFSSFILLYIVIFFLIVKGYFDGKAKSK